MAETSMILRIRKYLETHHPSAFLLAAQLILLILYAVVDGLDQQHELVGAINVLILLLVVWVIKHSPGPDRVAWVLAVPAFIFSIATSFLRLPLLLILSSLFEAALYLYAAGSMIIYMMGDSKVTTDELFAIGATFTLFAWGYAHLFMISQIVDPGSFINSSGQTLPFTFIQMLSVSFTNLTATGLSDITPVMPMARVIMMLSQFTGVGYVAVVVSRLIGMTLQRKR